MAFYDGLTPTIYASTADIGTGDGSSEANAMDLPTALSTVTAGGIVGLLPGVYSGAPKVNDWEVIFTVTNAGTSGNPIIIVGKYDALLYYADTNNRTELRSSDTGTACPVIGAESGNNYVQFRNLFIDQTHVPPKPSFGTLQAYNSTGVRFKKCVVSQTVNSTLDNYNAIFANECTDLQVDYCYFYGGTGAGNHNASAITTYSCYNYTIEHNTVEDANCGFFIKGASTSRNYGTIRYNKILDCSNSGIEVADSDSTQGTDVYQNVVARCENGVNIDSSSQAFAVRVYSNTLVDCEGVGSGSCYNVEDQDLGIGTAHVFRDNISAFTASSSRFVVGMDGDVAFSIFSTLDYNLYWESGTSAQFHQGGTTSTGLVAWQTASSLEANSDEANPNFTSAATDDYTLSVADTGSSTGGARGAYITGNELLGAVEDAAAANSVGPCFLL